MSVEIGLVVGIIFCAALLTSLAPPSQALAQAGKANATVGPGAVTRAVEENGYQVELQIAPNRAAVENDFSIKVTKDGEPVTGARVTTGFSMLDMEMGTQSYNSRETAPGVYSPSSPALVIVDHWGIELHCRAARTGAVHRPLRRRGRSLIVSIRFGASFVALAAGVAAVVVVVVLIHQTVT